MAYFITCSLPILKYRDRIYTNNPINIDLILKISKLDCQLRYGDTKNFPVINFSTIAYGHTDDFKWSYDSEKERDLDFEKISQNLK